MINIFRNILKKNYAVVKKMNDNRIKILDTLMILSLDDNIYNYNIEGKNIDKWIIFYTQYLSREDDIVKNNQAKINSREMLDYTNQDVDVDILFYSNMFLFFRLLETFNCISW